MYILYVPAGPGPGRCDGGGAVTCGAQGFRTIPYERGVNGGGGILPRYSAASARAPSSPGG
jgi:hypothetical protein